MNKGFIKISALLSVLALAFVAGVTLFSGSSVNNALAHYSHDDDDDNEDNESDNCEYNCPVVHFEWDTQVVNEQGHYVYADKTQVIDVAGHYTCPNGKHLGTGGNANKCYYNGSNIYYGSATWVADTYKYECPAGYSNNPGHSNCRKWINTTYTTIHHTADVQYDKSNDPHKCHRPSDSTLENTYGMDDDARHDFKNQNNEWMYATKVENSCSQNVTPTPTPTTVQSTATPTPTNVPCGQDCIDVTPTPTPTVEQPTATPTNTPSNPGGPGDGKSDGRSDGRSSCPECTQAPQGQVLGASTMAGTGTFEQNLMNSFAIFGMLLLTAGYKSYAKEKAKI